MWDVTGTRGRRISSPCSEHWVTPRNIWSSTMWWLRMALVDSSGDLITIYNVVSKGKPSASYKQLTYNRAFGTLPSVGGRHLGSPLTDAWNLGRVTSYPVPLFGQEATCGICWMMPEAHWSNILPPLAYCATGSFPVKITGFPQWEGSRFVNPLYNWLC